MPSGHGATGGRPGILTRAIPGIWGHTVQGTPTPLPPPLFTRRPFLFSWNLASQIPDSYHVPGAGLRTCFAILLHPHLDPGSRKYNYQRKQRLKNIRQLQRCSWDLKPVPSPHPLHQLSLKEQRGLWKCPGTLRKRGGVSGGCVSGAGQGEAVQEMPASLRAAEEHRLSTVRVAGGRGHCRQRGQPVQRHGGLK